MSVTINSEQRLVMAEHLLYANHIRVNDAADTWEVA